MASTEAVKQTEEEAAEAPNEEELDQAIDDLRGVLEQDAAGADAGSDTADAEADGDDDPLAADFSAQAATGEAAGGLEDPVDGLEDPADGLGADAAGEPDFAAGGFSMDDFPDTADSAEEAPVESDTPDMNNLALNSMELPATTGASGTVANSDIIMDIPVEVQIVLGKTRMKVSSLMQLDEGATISLDRRIGESVDVMVNGRMIGRGEITVLAEDETRFGVKLTEVLSAGKPSGAA